MANSNASPVFKTEEIQLVDGRTVELKPVTLKKLRQANKMIRALTRMNQERPEDVTEEDWAEEQEELFLVKLLEIVDLCVGKQVRKSEDEDLEEVFDIDSMYKVIEICVGIKLNDPNLVRAAMEAAAESR